MKYPFKIIESKISSRSEFDVLDGYQPTHALFYLKKGSFSMEIDGAKEKIEAGDCVILPDYIYFHRNVIQPIEFVYIKFAYDNSCPYSFEIPYGKVSFKDKNRFETNIQKLEELMLTADMLSAGLRNHLLMDILFQLYFENNTQKALPQTVSSHDSSILAALAFIDTNIKNKIKVDDICRAAGTNPSTLGFKFRRDFGCSVMQFVINERLKKAKHLLLSTTYSVSEIAERCGFENVYYFSNTFKKTTGISPLEYRKWK